MTVAPAPSVSAGPAAHTDRILRLFARFISVGYLGYLLLLSGAISTLAPRMQTWWTAAAVVVVFGTGLLPAAASFRPDTRAIRHGAGVAAVAFLLATALWPVAWVGPELPGDDGIWLAAFPGLDGLAAVIAWSTAVAFGYLVVACVGVELANAAARGDFGAGLLIPQIAFAIMFCSIFVGGAAMALRTGRVLDATTAQTRAAAAAAATQAARAAERERFDALIHDGVMATLRAAAPTVRSPPTPRWCICARPPWAPIRTLGSSSSTPTPRRRRRICRPSPSAGSARPWPKRCAAAACTPARTPTGP